jgi:hypothetical protein
MMIPWRPFHAVLPSGSVVDVSVMNHSDLEPIPFARLFAVNGSLPSLGNRILLYQHYQELAIETTLIIRSLMIDSNSKNCK